MTRTVIQVRLSREDKERISERAGGVGLSLSEYVRVAALSFVPLDMQTKRPVVPADEDQLLARPESAGLTVKEVAERQRPLVDGVRAQLEGSSSPLDALGKCPYTAKQLQGRTGLPLAACVRHIKDGSWGELL